MSDALPALPLEAWEPTKTTLHLYLQIAGKVRLALHPKLNHWWHVPFYVSARGLSTHAIPCADRQLEIELDFLGSEVVLRCSTGAERRFALADGLSVAAFYGSLMAALRELGLAVDILARPYDPERAGSAIPFAEDQEHASYDADYVLRFWRILSWIDRVLSTFRGRFTGKTTPVHLFWHSLDLAHTRFSGRPAPLQSGGPVDREAYSHEVISFGFWPGDANVRAPAFYSYTYPAPAGLAETELRPAAASWQDTMALLMYDDVRQSADPAATLLEFFESTYRAGATLGGWDVEALAART